MSSVASKLSVTIFGSALLAMMCCLGSKAQGKPQNNAKEAFARDYREYLTRTFPAQFSSIVVDATQITLEMKIKRSGRVDAEDLVISALAAHVPSQREIVSGQLCEAPVVKDGGQFRAVIPRFSEKGHDRSHYRFVLVHQNRDKKLTALTAAGYPNQWDPEAQRNLEKLVGRDQKGLGGVPNDSAEDGHQIYELGLSHATINIVLNGLIRPSPAPGFQKWDFEGRALYINEKRLIQFDRRIEKLREKKIVTSLILLVSNQHDKNQKISSPLVHPEANLEGKFAMPNLATPKGALLYRAIIHHLAERFSREGPTAARVSNWIMHNEIDQSGVWTTMGDQPIERYMEMFMRSARLVHHVTRQFNPHSRVFVSLTHHWNRVSKTQSAYRVRDIVEYVAKASQREGDFEWGIAYHPYPTNLRDSRSWNDKGTTFDFDTPLITPRNIEVLPAFLDQPRFRYLGKHQRAILLSEQGCSSESLSLEDQKVQAAGIVYMFFRMRHLSTVEAFHFHRYRDHPVAEGGTRFGLVDENGNPKFAWTVYQSLNTGKEASATAFAWPIMGAEARRHALNRRPIASPR